MKTGTGNVHSPEWEANVKGIRKGAWIKCKDKEEADQIQEQLGREGYSTVRRSEKYIRVTAEPDEGQRAAAGEEDKDGADHTGTCSHDPAGDPGHIGG